MSARAAFEQRLAASFSPEQWGESGVVVAFSAGPDSTALLASLAELRDRNGGASDEARGRLVAAHFNHRLRGADSEADEAHAVEMSRQLNVECVVGRGDAKIDAAEQGDGIEAAARDARYRFLTETAMRLGLRYIATAHTLDDQAETVLHRLLRGTGIAGLAGIPRVRPIAEGTLSLIRPLLTFRRAEVIEYLAARGLEYRVDGSNADVGFTRNRIRHELLPQLARDYNPRIVEALVRLAEQADGSQQVVANVLAPLAEQALLRCDARGLEIRCDAFRDASRHEVRETLVSLWKQSDLPQQGMGYDEWNLLADLALEATPRTSMLPGKIRAQKTGESLSLTRPSS